MTPCHLSCTFRVVFTTDSIFHTFARLAISNQWGSASLALGRKHWSWVNMVHTANADPKAWFWSSLQTWAPQKTWGKDKKWPVHECRSLCLKVNGDTLRKSNMSLYNPPFTDDFPINLHQKGRGIPSHVLRYTTAMDSPLLGKARLMAFIEGSLEVKLPTIWTDEKQSRAEAERRERLEERRVEEKESKKRRCRCAKW